MFSLTFVGYSRANLRFNLRSPNFYCQANNRIIEPQFDGKIQKILSKLKQLPLIQGSF